MKIDRSYDIAAPPAEVLAYVLSPDYLEALEAAHPDVLSIEELVAERSGGKVRRKVRFEARTKLPGFLSRFADRAPDTVFWDEHGTWDTERRRYDYEFLPEMPAQWYDRLTQSAQWRLEPSGAGTRSTRRLELKVRLLGLGGTIERALGDELDKLIEAERHVLQARFGG